MSIIKNKIYEINKIAQETRLNLKNNLIAESAECLDRYRNICMNIQYYHLKADFYMQVNDINSAIATLKECEALFPLSAITYVKLYNAYFLINDCDNFFKYWLAAYLTALSTKDEETQQKIHEEINRYLDELCKRLPKQPLNNLLAKFKSAKLDVSEPRFFPKSTSNDSMILEIIEDEKGGQWLVNNYRESPKIARLITKEQQKGLYLAWNTEIVKGTKITGSVSLTAERDNESVCLPICVLREDETEEPSLNQDIGAEFLFDIDGREIPMRFKPLIYDAKFYYARIDNANHIKIKSPADFFIGNPISMHHKPGLKKNVIFIFIDSLSSKHLQNNGLAKLMPNTYRFFKDGFIGTNVCSAGEWTLPSYASIATGLNTQNHQLYYAESSTKINPNAKLMAEYYSEKGYFTTNIQNNWRITPTYGYYKGFDRTIYQTFYGDFDCSKVTAEALESLQAFEETNNFLSLHFMDLHAITDKLFESVSDQTKINLSDIVEMEKMHGKSIDFTYNEHMVTTYNKILKRTDVYLGIIFDYLLANYNDDEITVVLASDHGQSYLNNEENESTLHEHRVLVPFMVRDVNAPCLVSDEILQSTDILPTMLKLNDIPIDRPIDGIVPLSFGGTAGRDFACSERVYPGQTYKAALTTKTHIYRFETKNTLSKDGTIALENFTAKYINRQTKKDEAALYPEKMSCFEEQVFNHIKNIICI